MPDLAPIKPDALANIFIKKGNKLLGQKSEGDENTDCLQLKAYVNGNIVQIKRVLKVSKEGAIQNISKRLVEIYKYNSYTEIRTPNISPQDYSSGTMSMWVGWIPFESGNTYGEKSALACGSPGSVKGDYAFGQYQFDVGQGDFFSESNNWAFIPFAYASYPNEFSGFKDYLKYNKDKFWADPNAKSNLNNLFADYANRFTDIFLWCQNQVFSHFYVDPVIKYCANNGIPENYLYNPFILGTLASMSVRQGSSFSHGNARMYSMFQSLKNSVNNNSTLNDETLKSTIDGMYVAFGDTRANWTGPTMDYKDKGRWTGHGGIPYGEPNQWEKCISDINSNSNIVDFGSTVSYPTSSEVLSFINSPIIANSPEDFNYYSVDPGISFYIDVTFRFKRNVNTNSDINIASNLASIERSGYKLYIDKDNILIFDLISKNGTVYRKTFMKLEEDTNNSVNINSGKWHSIIITKRKNGPVVKLKNGTIEPGRGQEILNNKEFRFSNEGGRQFKFGDVDTNQNSIVSFKDKIVFCGADQSGLIEDLCTIDFSNSTLDSGVLNSSTA